MKLDENISKINKTQTGFAIVGVIDFDSAPALRELGEACIADLSEISVDLSEVTEVDSSGLALMLAWLRCAKRQEKPIHFQRVPPSLCEVAGICNLTQILGLSVSHG